MPSSRRAFLRSAVLFGSAALVAACSPAATPPPLTGQPAPTTAPTSPPPAAAAAPTLPPAVPTLPPPAPTLAPPAVSQAAAQPTSLKAAWVAKTANQMVWPLARDAGYFDKYGINFDLNYLNGSATAIAALVAKDLDVASVAGSAIVGAQAVGQDIVMVAGFLNQAVFRILAAADLRSIDDVKAKTVGVTRVGQADYYAWQIVMENQHWSPDDVTFVNAGDVNGQVALLQQGAVQAIAVSPPNDVLATKIGAHLLLDTASLNVPEQNVGLGVTRATWPTTERR